MTNENAAIIKRIMDGANEIVEILAGDKDKMMKPTFMSMVADKLMYEYMRGSLDTMISIIKSQNIK